MEAQKPSILVIDDEVGMREGCRRALTSQGLRVSTAEHGAEGLHKLREGSFAVVLVDAMMPGMSGLELLEAVYEHNPDVVCVMITGYATVDLAAQAMKQGAFDFLPKPFSLDELLTVVNRGLEEHQRRAADREQRERAEEALQWERARAETAKLDAIESRFMLVIAHELRNPAGVIKNYLQFMRSGYADASETAECLDKLEHRADQLLAMLDDILELAHLKQQSHLSKPEPVPVAQVLEEVVSQLQPAAEVKGLQLAVHLKARPTVLANRNYLHSLWTKLIDNAIRYTPQGQVTATLDEQEGCLVATVADTGIGISDEELRCVFQEFYRSESAKAIGELGTGLGLPIVAQIVRLYNGTIEVDSTPGQGATFTIKLPVTRPDAEGQLRTTY
ncbi:MAG: response regulator [Anaerolineae bacterium]|nr:response regulator [Anaerolineae bacterium]